MDSAAKPFIEPPNSSPPFSKGKERGSRKKREGDSYPVLLLPPILTGYLQSLEKLDTVNDRPIKPVSPGERLRRSGMAIYGSIALVGSVTVTLARGYGSSPTPGLLLAALVGLVIGVGCTWRYLSAAYRSEMEVYREAVEKYERILALSLRGERERRRKIKRRSEGLKKLLSGKVLRPAGESQARKGVSEEYFMNHLKPIFGEAVRWGGEFPIPGGDYKYSHDMMLVYPASGICIDIEIDEPYEGKTRRPHHCTDDVTDTRRDRFFLDGNWIVVRFAEEQVVRYPDACCRYLAFAIASLTRDGSYSERADVGERLPPVSRWTRAVSREMARGRVRERYLKEAGLWR
jgi:hypothetical protein